MPIWRNIFLNSSVMCHDNGITDFVSFKWLRRCLLVFLGLVVSVGNASVSVVDSDIIKASELYQEGNIDQAITMFVVAAYAGSATAKYNLSVIYFNMERTDLNIKEFEFWLNESAKAGDSDAQFNLGMHMIGNEDKFEHVVKGVA